MIKRPLGYMLLSVLLLPCQLYGGLVEGLQAYQDGDYQSAYRHLRPLSDTAGPHLQELVGVMHYFGLGTPMDRQAARIMFVRAARQAASLPAPYLWDHGSRRFLSVGNKPSGDGTPEVDSQNATLSISKRLQRGSEVFLVYCAGCHGFNGFAFYPPAPSFSMQERMYKSDAELMQTILKGRNAMPSWENKLPRQILEAALEYIRHMARIRREGGALKNAPPPYYYIFWSD